MDQSLPDFIQIRWIGTEICAIFHKTKKIEFSSPPELRGKVVQSINEAVRLVDDEDQYYYSHAQWEVLEPKGWTVWRYERRVAALNQQIQAAEDVQKEKSAQQIIVPRQSVPIQTDQNPRDTGDDTKSVTETNIKDDKIELVDDPRICNNWTSDHVAKWIFQHNNPKLPLIEIKYFRRYNHGLCFEFFCVWDCKDTDGNFRQTWQKYTDLHQTASYNAKIREQWDYEIERFRHFEDYGPDPIDSQLILPPLSGDAYYPDKITEIATKKMKKEEQELKKGSRSRKKRSPAAASSQTKKNHSSKRLRAADTDSDDELNSGESASNSDEDNNNAPDDNDTSDKNDYITDSDHNEVPLNITSDRNIFETSSVFPVPRYKVKWFKRRVVKKNK